MSRFKRDVLVSLSTALDDSLNEITVEHWDPELVSAIEELQRLVDRKLYDEKEGD